MLERKGADNSRALLCPMPGLVKSIAVKEGQEVKAGEPLCMVEAMKMENVLLAERDVDGRRRSSPSRAILWRSTRSSWSLPEPPAGALTMLWRYCTFAQPISCYLLPVGAFRRKLILL